MSEISTTNSELRASYPGEVAPLESTTPTVNQPLTPLEAQPMAELDPEQASHLAARLAINRSFQLRD